MRLPAIACCLLWAGTVFAVAPETQPAELAKPTTRTVVQIEGWTVRMDDRLAEPAHAAAGRRARQLLEAQLANIRSLVPPEPLAKLQAVTIVLDLTHGQLHPMQYHPSAEWLAGHGYARDLARCVHIPDTADFVSPRHNSDQPWCVLHELAHAYHDQVLGFDEPRIMAAFERYGDSGHGEAALHVNGRRVRHYALTNQKEFFAEMTEAYFGSNDFFPFNRGELMTAEPQIYALLRSVWKSAPTSETPTTAPASKDGPAVDTAKVDRLFAKWDQPDSPGCALAIIQNDRIIYARGYGQADLEQGIPITPTTIFNIASVSKQFTSMAVLLLAHDGKLALDDDIRKYIPELADFGKTITVRHLIHHTSGLRDTWELLQFAGWRMEDVITWRDALDLTWRQRELNTDPGDAYDYCNGGYMLLGLLVERVSGQTLAKFAQARIFQPLGMSNTHFEDEYRTLIPRRAQSYDPRRGGGFQLNGTRFTISGPTSVFTTVEDLAKWDHNFDTAQVGGPAVIDQMQQCGQLNNGQPLTYAAALRISTYRGLRTVDHNGARAGFRSVYLRFPEQHFSVVILANLGTISPSSLAKKVAELYLGDQMQPPVALAAAKPDAAPAAGQDPAHPQDYVGDFYSVELEVIFRLRVNDGRLMLRHRKDEQPLLQVDGDRFHTHFDAERSDGDEYVDVRFSRDERGRIDGFRISNDRAKGIRFVRIQLPE